MNNNMPDQILKIINNLRNYYTIKETIKLDEKYLKESPLNGVSYDGVKTSATNKMYSVTEDLAQRRLDKENRIRVYQDIIMQIDAALTILSDVERQIITYRDIEQYTWMQVEYHVKLSESQCKRVRKRALTKMQEYIYNERYDFDTKSTQLSLGL
ncbi:sigma factor-like helix-turn-helix DNA-binding protein [Vallitalea sediminicola]